MLATADSARISCPCQLLSLGSSTQFVARKQAHWEHNVFVLWMPGFERILVDGDKGPCQVGGG